ncbi:MAG: radical SAM/SPASM domain-containing protein [Desulfovibrio sp.]
MRKNDFVEKELMTQQNRLRYIESTLTGRTSADFVPRRVFIEVTNNCNYRCIHCPSHTVMTRQHGFMDFDLYTAIIDELAPHWRELTVNLYKTGEPTLHPRIYDMLDYANDKGLFVQMNSNFGAVKKKDIPRLGTNFYLGVSIDAATAPTYKAIKNGKDFWAMLDVFLDYLEAWGEGADHEAYACDAIFLRQDSNWDEAELFEEMFSRLPVGHVAIYPMHNFTGDLEGSNGVRVRTADIPHSEWPSCNVPWDVTGINWNGDMVACIYDVNGRYLLGNVREQGVLDAWRGAEMERFRKNMRERDFDAISECGLHCKDCSIIWDPSYHIPKDYYSEVGRMEQYLSAAVKRVSLSRERHEEVMERWRYLKQNRQAWLDELRERGEALLRARAAKAQEG